MPAIGDVRLRDLGTRDVDHLYAQLPHDLKPSSRRRYHAVLSAALELAVRRDYLPANPAKRATVPKLSTEQVRPPSADDVVALIAAMPGPVWAMALRLAVVTGARRGEITALRWSDVRDGLIHVDRSCYRLAGSTTEKTTKAGRGRVVVVEADGPVADLLRDWQAWCLERAADAGVTVPPDGFIVSTWPDCSSPINPDTLSAYVRKAALETGRSHVHMHSLRHFAATELFRGWRVAV